MSKETMNFTADDDCLEPLTEDQYPEQLEVAVDSWAGVDDLAYHDDAHDDAVCESCKKVWSEHWSYRCERDEPYSPTNCFDGSTLDFFNHDMAEDGEMEEMLLEAWLDTCQLPVEFITELSDMWEQFRITLTDYTENYEHDDRLDDAVVWMTAAIENAKRGEVAQRLAWETDN